MPRQLRQHNPCLHVAHVHSDAASRPQREGVEGAFDRVRGELLVVVWMRLGEPALGMEVAGAGEVTLRVGCGEEGRLDGYLLKGMRKVWLGGCHGKR